MPISSLALASGQVHSSTSWSCHLLSDWVSDCLSQKVENICQYRCKDSEIWHGASLGTLIKIQEEPIWRTMWGPCFGHNRAIFLPFIVKGDYQIHPELWNLAWTIPVNINYDSGRTNEGPCEYHVFAIYSKLGYRIHQAMWNLAWIIPGYIE